jgi:hypothetical protein
LVVNIRWSDIPIGNGYKRQNINRPFLPWETLPNKSGMDALKIYRNDKHNSKRVIYTHMYTQDCIGEPN